MNFRIALLCFIAFTISFSFAQEEGFKFQKSSQNVDKIKFVNFNNLIIIKVRLNGRHMNFLLDSGVDKTILFGLDADDDKIKNSSQKLIIKGVSGNYKTYAYKNENNRLEIGNLIDESHDIYAIFDKNFNVSDKIGYKIQGIIGYEFFKNKIVKINYIKNHIKVYEPDRFKKYLKAYQRLDLRLYRQKPYIKALIQHKDDFEEFVFLLDTGSGDAIWLRQQSETTIPQNNFNDILGYGMADIIRGKRAKAKQFKLGKHVLKQPKIAFPDTLSYPGLSFTKKSGVVGAEVMRRFHWFFDYDEKQVFIKPNNDFYDKFNYDMSGLLLIYDGYQTITKYKNVFSIAKSQTDNSAGYNKVKDEPEFYLELKPVLKVGAVRPNSSAYEAGFVEGDEILKINGKSSYIYNMQEIMKMLSSEEGKRFNFQIKRRGRVYEKTLFLKSRFLE